MDIGAASVVQQASNASTNVRVKCMGEMKTLIERNGEMNTCGVSDPTMKILFSVNYYKM